MKSDIEIPEVRNIYLAAVYVNNIDLNQQEWNVYLINDSSEVLETILIVSSGSDSKRKTSVLRHKLDSLPSKTFAKIEYLPEDVLKLKNEFRISYFQNGKLYDAKFTFPKDSIKRNRAKQIPVIPEKGILAE